MFVYVFTITSVCVQKWFLNPLLSAGTVQMYTVLYNGNVWWNRTKHADISYKATIFIGYLNRYHDLVAPIFRGDRCFANGFKTFSFVDKVPVLTLWVMKMITLEDTLGMSLPGEVVWWRVIGGILELLLFMSKMISKIRWFPSVSKIVTSYKISNNITQFLFEIRLRVLQLSLFS